MQKKIVINDVFEQIDNQLAEQGVHIAHRYLKAVGEVSKYFNNTPVPISPESLLPNNELGNQLCIWLHKWYDAKYGENQHFNFDLGFFYQKFRGDLWHYRVPEFFGRCNFFIDKNLKVKGAENETNIMRMSPKMTQSYVNSLTEAELKELSNNFGNAIESFQIVSGWRVIRIPYYEAIDADFKTITAQLEPHVMNYGQARWAYLQCAEKILKSWLLKAEVSEEQLKNKFGHNIHKLLNAFNKYYEVELSSRNLDNIECAASARYGDKCFTSDDIVAAQNWLFCLIRTIGFSPTVITAKH